MTSEQGMVRFLVAAEMYELTIEEAIRAREHGLPMYLTGNNLFDVTWSDDTPPCVIKLRMLGSYNPESYIRARLVTVWQHVAKRQFERAYVSALLIRTGGNMSAAARLAGVDRSTFYRMAERHGLRPKQAAERDSRQ